MSALVRESALGSELARSGVLEREALAAAAARGTAATTASTTASSATTAAATLGALERAVSLLAAPTHTKKTDKRQRAQSARCHSRLAAIRMMSMHHHRVRSVSPCLCVSLT